MSELEQPSKPFPVDDGVVVKLPVGTDIVAVGGQVFRVSGSPLYNSSSDFVNKIVEPILDHYSPKELFEQGIKVEMLEPGKQWKTGKFRCRLVFEFIPDDPEITETTIRNLSESPLDDIRKTMNANR